MTLPCIEPIRDIATRKKEGPLDTMPVPKWGEHRAQLIATLTILLHNQKYFTSETSASPLISNVGYLNAIVRIIVPAAIRDLSTV